MPTIKHCPNELLREIFGIALQSALSVFVDGSGVQNISSTSLPSFDAGNDTSSSSIINSTLLVSVSGLDEGSHVLSLITHTSSSNPAGDGGNGNINGSGLVIFDRAVVTVSSARTG